MNINKVSLKDRLNEALALREKKAADLAKDLNIPKSAISQYLSGKSQNMDENRLQKIAKYLDVSEPWLMGFDVPRAVPDITLPSQGTEITESFSFRLQTALDKSGMSQSELANISGITKSSLSRYLSGKFEPKYSAVTALARALNVTVDYLMGLSSETQIPTTQMSTGTFATEQVVDPADLHDSYEDNNESLQFYKEKIFNILLRLHTDAQFLEIVAKIGTLDKDRLQALQQFLKAFGE